MKEYDFIIIGSGPCGLLSASILSSHGECCVIEQGKEIDNSEHNIYTFDQISNAYVGGGINLAFGNPPVILSEGMAIGGGSEVNSSLHHRAPKHIWKMWHELYGLEGFEQDTINQGYKDIEKLFNTEETILKPSIFYTTAKNLGEKVSLIPRWGKEDTSGNLDRFTASKIFLKKLFSNNGKLISQTKYLAANLDKNNKWIIKLENLKTKTKFNLKTKYLILALGAGYTPCALYDLGLRHKQLGKFEIHPTARVSIYYPINRRPKSIVEPFQITGHFPYLMIGSSANRTLLSESNYPYKKNIHNIDFNKVQNFYSMAPSNNKGKIFLSGLMRGTKLYFLDQNTKSMILKGLKIILKIALNSKGEFLYFSHNIIDLKTKKDTSYYTKFLNQCIKSTLSSVHIMASSSIGENKNLCPLNSKGMIRGINNLLVVDQSSFPSCPTVNPQATASLISLINTKKFIDSL